MNFEARVYVIECFLGGANNYGWRGGLHHGFPTDNGKVTYLTAEVRLYLNNAYQMTFSTHPTVSNELDDRELVKMVHDVTYALFVINKPETP